MKDIATRLQHTGPLHGLMHWQNLRLRLVPMPNLAVALVGATYLARPVLPLRCLLPPTLT